MKIVIVTQDAPTYLAQFLDTFFLALSNAGHRVDRIVVFPPYFSENRLRELLDRFECYGAAAFLILSGLIFANKLKSVAARLMPSGGCHLVKDVVRKHAVSKLVVDSINSTDFIDYVRGNRVDVIVSIASPKIFRKEILSAPRIGCINYHTGLLPRYRGRQPLFWALLNGERTVGISIHEMEQDLDSGAIIVQKQVPVRRRETLHSLYRRTVQVGPPLLVEALGKLARGCAARIVNDPRQATYFSVPTREDGQAFRAGGNRFF